ncbi:MAG: cytochrome P450 [Gammaproteobacteria bacterium]
MKPIVRFDHNSREYGRNWRAINDRLRSECPVGWSESHGGFWVVTRHRDVAEIARDDATFSSAFANGGVLIPPSPSAALPIMMDPPEFYTIRRLLNPWFSPARMVRWEARILEWTTQALDAHVESGAIDFVMDLGNLVPGKFTVSVLGLPIQDWFAYAEPQHLIVSYPTPGEGDPHRARMHAKALAGQRWCVEEILKLIPKRRADPQDDLISFLATADAGGRRLTDEEISGTALLVLAGGVDTTTALLACALLHLHEHADDRQRLIEQPALIGPATEEFLRYYSIVQGLARTVMRPVEIGGQPMAPGERVFISWASANFDPEAFDEPDRFILDREPNRHSTFGLGIHRCLGSSFARMEFRIMLEQILKRMPDFSIDVAACEPYEAIANANGYVSMPGRFSPGPRIGGA